MQSLEQANQSISVDRQQSLCRQITVRLPGDKMLCSNDHGNPGREPDLGVDPQLLRLYKAMDLAG